MYINLFTTKQDLSRFAGSFLRKEGQSIFPGTNPGRAGWEAQTPSFSVVHATLCPTHPCHSSTSRTPDMPRDLCERQCKEARRSLCVTSLYLNSLLGTYHHMIFFFPCLFMYYFTLPLKYKCKEIGNLDNPVYC